MSSIDMPFFLFFGVMCLVAGGLIVWFLMVEHPFETPERRGGPVDAAEASLLVKALTDDGRTVDEETVVRVLELHTAYFDGRIYDTLAAAENARMAAARARQAAAEQARREAVRQAAEAAASVRPAMPRPAARRRATGTKPEAKL